MLRFLETFTGQDTLALFMNLEHVEFRLFPRPPENGLKDMGDIVHEIDRIVPANDEVARLQAGFRLLCSLWDSTWLQLWNGGLGHKRKLEEERGLVESLGEEPDCPTVSNPPDSGCRIGNPVERALKRLNIPGCIPSNLCYAKALL
jgi:hypothetical protein